jgi:hypothetical protein
VEPFFPAFFSFGKKFFFSTSSNALKKRENPFSLQNKMNLKKGKRNTDFEVLSENQKIYFLSIF